MWVALIATVVIGALIYKLFWSRPNTYWKKFGIRQIDISSIVGPLDIVLGRKTIMEADDYIYDQMGSTDKFCGTVESGKPTLHVKDMELIKKIMIKDFDHFVDRRQFFSQADSCLSLMLGNLEGDEWKGVRASVSPTFTTGEWEYKWRNQFLGGDFMKQNYMARFFFTEHAPKCMESKIRRMMEYFNSVGLEWVEEFTRKAKSDPSGSVVIDVLNSINQYTVEVISTAVFGMNAGTIKNPKSTFSVMANRIADFSGFLQAMKFAMRIQFPRISNFLKITIIDAPSLSFFERILEQGLKSRLTGETTKRNDFLQLLVEAKKGELQAVGSDELSEFEKEAQITGVVGSKQQYLTDEIMTAQAVLFFFAGFSGPSNLTTHVLYAIALHPTIQDKLRQEVGKIAKEDGSFDYDEIGQLVYLDMVVCETLRKFPGMGRIERICVREYRKPEIGLVIPKGTIVAIPAHNIHHSEEYYENPHGFDPSHFSPDKKAERSPYAFMPFGIGPRNCIGIRFALIEMKAAIAHVVHNFKLEPTEKTPVPLQGKVVGFSVMPPKGLELKLTPIK